MASKVRFGIIGLKGYGANHVRALLGNPDAEVVALCDVDGTAARDLARESGVCKSFTDFRELLRQELDAVVVATPHFLHFPMTLAALESGKHVFCEKPLGLNAKEAHSLAKESLRRNLILSCNYNQRGTPAIQALKWAADSGRLGKIFRVNARWLARRTGFMFDASTDWRRSKAKSGGGILIGRGSHLIDAVQYILGHPEPESVSACIACNMGGSEVEDYGSFFVRIAGGTAVNVECSYILQIPDAEEKMEFEIYGDKGGIVYRHTGNQEPVILFGACDMAKNSWQDMTPSLRPILSGAPGIAYTLNSFVRATAGKGRALVAAGEAAQVNTILDAAYDSASQGKEIGLKGDTI